MITLFPDQQIDVEKIRASYRSGKRAPLFVAPCGYGKTVIFSYVTQNALKRGNKVLLLCHRVELIDQICAALQQFQVPHGVIAAGYVFRPGMSVYVASVFSLVRRSTGFVPDLIVIDEAHHCAGTTTWGKILARHSDAVRLGVTATPCRLGREPLDDFFDDLVLGSTPEELINLGRLSPLRTFAPPTIDASQLPTRGGDYVKEDVAALVNRPSITGSAVAHYQQHAPGRQAVVFCASIEHATAVAAEFRAVGFPSVSVDGTLHRDVRRRIIREFSDGSVKVLTSCDLVSEGFDCPRIEVGISLRPTKSLGLWLQQCGRVLRTFTGKSGALLLDHAGNTLRHGLPTEPRQWSLAGSHKKSQPNESKTSIRVCPECFSAQISNLSVCGNCGYHFKTTARQVEKRDGELEELTPEKLASIRAREENGQARSLEALEALGRMRGYNNPAGWAKHVWDARNLKRSRNL